MIRVLLLLAAIVAALPWLAKPSGVRVAGLSQSPGRATAGVAPPAPVLLELLAAALATGVSIPRALASVGAALPGPVGASLALAARGLELGATWPEAWAPALDDAPPVAGLGVVADALRSAWEDGTAPAAALRTAAEAERQRRRAAAKLVAARLAVRLVLPLGLCLLPAFILIGLLPILLSLGASLLGP